MFDGAMSEPAPRPQPPFLVDDRTVLMPCQPGAWGSPESCLTHEGQPLDEHGRCFWGRSPSSLERMLSTSLLAELGDAAKGQGVVVVQGPTVRLGQQKWRLSDDGSRSGAATGILDASTLMHAPMPSLLRLARALDVRVPRARPGAGPEEVKRALCKAIAGRNGELRAKLNPVVEQREAHGTLRTVG